MSSLKDNLAKHMFPVNEGLCIITLLPVSVFTLTVFQNQTKTQIETR